MNGAWWRNGWLLGLAWTAVMGLGLSACTLPLLERTEAAPKIHIFTLEWRAAAPPPSNRAKSPSLLIATPLAAAGYGGSDMLYMDDPFELKAFAWHRWADAPARLLEPLLLTAAERTGRFGTVVPAGTPGETDLRLETRLLYLRQVFKDDSCRVEMALRVTLVNNRSARILGTRDLQTSLPCTSPDPRGGAITANRIVAILLEQLQGFLRAHAPE
ncbi:MAG: hypothetical protein D6720_12310 [Gammaproteobacteria bacterium]|nr:MAG: hypothetical protein D6720_12310 [Gammaproteobacteria bacterium]